MREQHVAVIALARARIGRTAFELPSDPAPAAGASLIPARGRSAGFDEFYSASVARVVRYLYAVTGDMADAQDIAQEAFARAWQHWASVGGYESPEAWVRRVAFNLAASRWRRHRSARAAGQLLAVPEAVAETGPDTVALVAGLRTLPERQRQVLVLHYLLDLPVAQIASELGCPVGSVKAWLARGRAALALAIGEPAADEPSGTASRPGDGPEVADV
jgi:RNA polymerase sigma-70 factor, ECF subfamily